MTSVEAAQADVPAHKIHRLDSAGRLGSHEHIRRGPGARRGGRPVRLPVRLPGDRPAPPDQPLDLLGEASLADRLAQAIGVPAVDLVDLRRAPLRLLGRVLEEGRLLYSADELGRVAFEVRTRSEYFDFLPTYQAHRDQFLRRVAAGGLDG